MPRRRSRTVDQIERDARAVEYRRRGLTYRQIASEMGWKNQASAYEAVQRGLNDAIAEPAGEVRQLELERLDEYQRYALRVLAAPHLVVSQGVVVINPANGQPLTDDAPVLAALDRLLKISERRAKLLGLDAPARARIEVIDDEIASAMAKDLERQLAEIMGGQAPGTMPADGGSRALPPA
jgi:hypothetical protein